MMDNNTCHGSGRNFWNRNLNRSVEADGVSRLEHLLELLEQDPDDVFLNFALAMELVKNGDHEAAESRFERVKELDPDYVAAYVHQGHYLITQGRKEKAREVLKAGIERAQCAGDKHAADQLQRMLTPLE